MKRKKRPKFRIPQQIDAFAFGCASNAERRVGFDLEAASDDALRIICERGPISGEAVVDELEALGHMVHDGRAFGAVIRKLRKAKLIHWFGYHPHYKGRTGGAANVWAASVELEGDEWKSGRK